MLDFASCNETQTKFDVIGEDNFQRIKICSISHKTHLLSPMSLKVDIVSVTHSYSCMYLGRQQAQLENSYSNKLCYRKETVVFYSKNAVICRGTFRQTLFHYFINPRYKSTTILYNCLVWASAISKKHLIASLKAILSPFSLPIVRLFFVKRTLPLYSPTLTSQNV
jgi:hypothetical protein